MLTPDQITQIVALEDALITHLEMLMKHAPEHLRAEVVVREDILRLQRAPHRWMTPETNA